MANTFHSSGNSPDLAKKIIEGDMTALVSLYETNRRPVFSFIRRNHGTTDDAEDMLQEALVILWQRIRSGKFEQRAKLETFVYATVRNLWLRQLAKKRREIADEFQDERHESADPTALELMMEDEKASLVKHALQKLSEPCRSLLIAFYWDELSMEQIAQKLGFANAQTAKSKKYQCKQALKKLLS